MNLRLFYYRGHWFVRTPAGRIYQAWKFFPEWKPGPPPFSVCRYARWTASHPAGEWVLRQVVSVNPE
jgi:hypothetical protein